MNWIIKMKIIIQNIFFQKPYKYQEEAPKQKNHLLIYIKISIMKETVKNIKILI